MKLLQYNSILKINLIYYLNQVAESLFKRKLKFTDRINVTVTQPSESFQKWMLNEKTM